jgi:flagellar assembly protein FliH
MNGILDREVAAGFTRWEPPMVGDTPPPPAEPPRPTVSELEAIERQAREEGYAAGHREGLAAGRREIEARVARLEAMLAAAAQPLARLDIEVEEELARLAVTIARRVLAHELSVHPQRIVETVHRAVGLLPAGSRELRVHLHPDDLKLLRESGAADAGWQLIADPALSRGGCRIESTQSRLDATLEARLTAVIDAVLGAEEGDAP